MRKFFSHWLVITVEIFLGLVVTLFFLGWLVFRPSVDEVARVTSPNGLVDAVLMETNGGATTSFGYRVYILPQGSSTSYRSKSALIYGAERSEQAYGVNLNWESSSRVVAEYLRAEFVELEFPFKKVGGTSIELQLREGVNDPNAPPGGMLYNLRGRPYD